jgi:uncharacterized protein YkwD
MKGEMWMKENANARIIVKYILYRLLLVLFVCFIVRLDAEVLAAVREDSGTYNDINWRFNYGTGFLSFSGTDKLFVEWDDEILPEWDEYRSKTKRIVIGEGITEVGANTFSQFDEVRQVDFPSTLIKIDKTAFAYCDKLSEITLNDGLQSIDERAFQKCPLKSVTIPASVTYLNNLAFFDCTNLSELEVDAANPSYASQDNIIYNKDRTILFLYPEGLKKVNVIVPNGVTAIQEFAFYYSSINSIELPDTLKTIGTYAFYNSKLTSADMPINIDFVAKNAFPKGCNVTYPNGVLPLGDGSFKKAATLTIGVYESYQQAFAVLALVNLEREKAGIAKLVMDQELLSAAMLRAAELSINFGQVRPIGLGNSSLSQQTLGINIAYAQHDAAYVMELWMQSPGHQVNILNEKYSQMGVGCVTVNGIIYWVQVFGTEDSMEIADKNTYTDSRKSVSILVNPNADFYSASLKVNKNTMKIGESANLTYSCTNTVAAVPIDAKSLCFESSNNTVCSVSNTGIVKAVGKGTAKISAYPIGYNTNRKEITVTVTEDIIVPASNRVNLGSAKVSSKTKVIYTGKLIKPSVTLKLNGKTLKKGQDYTIHYKNNRRVGKATLIINGKGNYIGGIYKMFRILPRTRKITQIKSSTQKSMTVKWNGGSADVSKYQIQVSRKKNMKSAVYYTAKAKDKMKIIKKLKAGTRYYVRIRAVNQVNSLNYYSSWSQVRSIKIK